MAQEKDSSKLDRLQGVLLITGSLLSRNLHLQHFIRKLYSDTKFDPRVNCRFGLI